MHEVETSKEMGLRECNELSTDCAAAVKDKVVAKVLCHRFQKVLGVPIQDTQQVFVHGSQMSKIVMIMIAHLILATHEPDREPTDSRAILLLNIFKAYDTVSRDFLFEVMRYFGFANSLITIYYETSTITPQPGFS